MILYLDASALVKRYVAEPWSADVDRLIREAEIVGTGVMSRAEVSAALARAVRLRILSDEDGRKALQLFRAQWPDLVRLQLTEVIIAQADSLAWAQGLRGYDAVHLATAQWWQSMLGEPLTMVTFDPQLWQASAEIGLMRWPEESIG